MDTCTCSIYHCRVDVTTSSIAIVEPRSTIMATPAGAVSLVGLKLLVAKPVLLRPEYLIVPLYAIPAYLSFGAEALPFPGADSLAFIFTLFLHALTFLFQKWFVAARQAVSFAEVSTLNRATHVFLPKTSGGQRAGISALVRQDAVPASGAATGYGSAGSGSADPAIQSMLTLPSVRFQYQSLWYELNIIEGAPVATCAPLPDDLPLSVYTSWRGWSMSEEASVSDVLKQRYGGNRVDVPVPLFWDLFKEHAVAPFFVFQLFCVGLWCLDEYIWYSLFTLFTLFSLEATLVFQRIKTAQMLRGMRPPSHPVYVYRGAWKAIMSDELVPMDVVSLSREAPSAFAVGSGASAAAGGNGTGRPGQAKPQAQQQQRHDRMECPADILLLSGSVVVNEAMLTGESAPQMKECITEVAETDITSSSSSSSSSAAVGGGGAEPNGVLRLNAFQADSDKSHARSVVYGGTQIVQSSRSEGVEGKENANNAAAASASGAGTGSGGGVPLPPDGGAIGIVIRTAARTSQGELMRTIQHASEPVSASDPQALMFILGLLVFAIGASGYVLHHGLQDPGKDRWKLILHCIMIITSVVPPELPVELSLAVNASLATLTKKGIFCTEPFRIPLAGKIDVCCFDKTGTLTSDEFQVQGIRLLLTSDSDSHATQQAGSAAVDGDATDKAAASRSASVAAKRVDPYLLPLVPALSAPAAARLVIGGCHAILAVRNDPLPAPARPRITGHDVAVSSVPGTAAAGAQQQPHQLGPTIELVGDPVEKAALQSIGWTVDEEGVARPKVDTSGTGAVNGSGAGAGGGTMIERLLSSSSSSKAGPSIRVLRRWAFSSTLKRMTAIVKVGHASQLAACEKDGKPPAAVAAIGDKFVVTAHSQADKLQSAPASSSGGLASEPLFIVCKGAPEVVESLLSVVPEGYTAAHAALAADGIRVLALAYKPAGSSATQVSTLRRDVVERDLIFAGFLAVSCPLKTDSKRTIDELQASGHRVVMITGDAPLTAIAVAKELSIGSSSSDANAEASSSSSPSSSGPLPRPAFVLDLVQPGATGDASSASSGAATVVGEPWLTAVSGGGPSTFALLKGCSTWQDAVRIVSTSDASAATPSPSSSTLPRDSLVCVTGRALAFLERSLPQSDVAALCLRAHIFARVSPAQKERIVELFNASGHHTAMVGDGSNDSGALKRAHIGLAVISNPALERQYDLVRLKNVQRRKDAAAQVARGLPPPRNITEAAEQARLRNLAAGVGVDAEEEGNEVVALLRSEKQRETDAGILPDAAAAANAAGGNNNSSLNPLTANLVQAATSQRVQPGSSQEKLQKRLKELEAEAGSDPMGAAVVSLGDASMAAPLTSKLPTPLSLVDILRQGRCTLVTTHQMFKILAVNSLTLSYQLSVLYLHDVKSGDAQATFAGMSAAAFFLFLSWAKPVNRLSRERPQTTIFNPALLCSIFAQFLTHLAVLITVASMVGVGLAPPTSGNLSNSSDLTAAAAMMNATTSGGGIASSLVIDDLTIDPLASQDVLQAKLFAPAVDPLAAAAEAASSASGISGIMASVTGIELPVSDFKPNVINTAVFLATTAAQTCTFLVSYHGLPFMEPLHKNTLLSRGAAIVYVVVILGALGISSDLNDYFQLVPLADWTQRLTLAGLIVLDLVVCFSLETAIRRVFRAKND